MQSTISRCFKPGVSVLKKMRARIMNAAEDLGYQPNAIARSLISNTNAVFAPYRRARRDSNCGCAPLSDRHA